MFESHIVSIFHFSDPNKNEDGSWLPEDEDEDGSWLSGRSGAFWPLYSATKREFLSIATNYSVGSGLRSAIEYVKPPFFYSNTR